MAFYEEDYCHDSVDQDFTIDCLPLDCIVCICKYLPVNDLGRFGSVCKVKHIDLDLLSSILYYTVYSYTPWSNN